LLFRIAIHAVFNIIIWNTLICSAKDIDSNWRHLAEKRIEEFRKADISITVRDKTGKALSGAEVSVEMERHEFAFGTSVLPALITSSREEIAKYTTNRNMSFGSSDFETYKSTILKYFNAITIENELKWVQWYNPINRELVSRTIKWAKENVIPIRGHCIVWPGWQYLPSDLMTIRNDPPQLSRRIIDHISNIVSHYRREIFEWDVINEPISNHDLTDILGKAALIDWMKQAHKANPDAILVVNDFGILASRKHSEEKRKEYFALIQYLISNDAPLHTIGMQGHFKFEDGSDLTQPTKIYEILERFATLGKQIMVTEFDVNLPDEQKQAEYMLDFMIVVFSHPSVRGIILWGFWEGRSWRPFTALWRKDWSLKTNGKVWIDLVYNKWWTNTKGKTDNSGLFTTRAFLGDYRITIRYGDNLTELRTHLSKAGATIVCDL